MTATLVPISDEAILAELATQPNRWPLKDITVLALGFDYRVFDWSQADGNASPRRPYENAEIAIDRNELRGRKDAGEYQVTKKDFVDWLEREYGTLITFQRFIDLYTKYKSSQIAFRPSEFFTFRKEPIASAEMLRVWNRAYEIGLDDVESGCKFSVKKTAAMISKEFGKPVSTVNTYISHGGIRKLLIQKIK